MQSMPSAWHSFVCQLPHPDELPSDLIYSHIRSFISDMRATPKRQT